MTTWHEKPLGQRSLENLLYQNEIVDELKKHPRPKRTPVQCASTQKNLERQALRPKEADYLWAHRPFEVDPTVINEKNEIVIPKCEASLSDIESAFKARSMTKNQLGQSVLEGTSLETKEKAAHALTYSQPYQLKPEDVAHIKSLQPYTPLPMPVEEEDKSLAGKAIHLLWKMGLPVDRLIKKKLSVEVADK